ncbi:MAG TPA: HPF/RaiA family ribosome-associated protein [Terriglobales bacterium]|jgi:cold shock CspA family protein|nr:HPF/RaiA family ribosome-associated protein [Terriglobales bacterium]
MKIPLKITFRDMAPSKAIEKHIRERVAKLDSLHDGITSCRVNIAAPHRHHHKGKAYVVRIDMTVPGTELVINRAPKRLEAARAPHQELEKDLAENHKPSKHAAHADAYVALRDAFNAAERKLKDFARRRHGKAKAHALSATARVARLFPIEDFGFLETPDGREIYFHRNSVMAPGFERLEVGTEVFYSETSGFTGPQASTVRVVSP